MFDIESHISKLEDVHTVIDIFSGSGAVSAFLKSKHYRVIGNDIMYFAYVISRGTTGINEIPKFKELNVKDPLKYLNDLSIEDTNFDINDCFIYQNYAPHDEVKRMYFQPENALKIDVIRKTIELWRDKKLLNEDEYYYLLGALLSAVPYVSNITGVYGAYLKHWDKRTYNRLILKAPEISNAEVAEFYNENADDLLPKTEIKGDLLYADPPYNSRQYLPNYHILETIAKYDYPEIRGVTGMRNYQTQKSDFCCKNKVESAFRRMIEEAKVKYILISYNNEGLLSTDALSKICEDYTETGTFKLTEIDYRRYNNASTKKSGVKEQLYFFKKKE